MVEIDDAIKHLIASLPLLGQIKSLVGKEFVIEVVEADPKTGHQAVRLEWPGVGALKRVRAILKGPIQQIAGLGTRQPSGAQLYASNATRFSQRDKF